MTGPVDQSHLTPRPVRRVSYRRQQIFTPEGLTLLPDKRPDFRARTGRAQPVALPPATSTILLHAETKPRATKQTSGRRPQPRVSQAERGLCNSGPLSCKAIRPAGHRGHRLAWRPGAHDTQPGSDRLRSAGETAAWASPPAPSLERQDSFSSWNAA